MLLIQGGSRNLDDLGYEDTVQEVGLSFLESRSFFNSKISVTFEVVICFILKITLHIFIRVGFWHSFVIDLWYILILED